jgi:hypothetical protein
MNIENETAMDKKSKGLLKNYFDWT